MPDLLLFKDGEHVKLTIETDEWIAVLDGRMRIELGAIPTLSVEAAGHEAHTPLDVILMTHAPLAYDVSLRVRLSRTGDTLGRVDLKTYPIREGAD